jgi:membrane protease YdiL (CAAX protease family)
MTGRRVSWAFHLTAAAELSLAGIFWRPPVFARSAMKKNSFRPFLIYLALFYLTWTFVWVYGVFPWANRTIGNATLSYALVNIAFRFLIWILPVWGYLRYIDNVNVLEYLQLKQQWKRGVIVGLTLSVINFLGTVARIGPPVWSSANITWNSILGTSMLVGVFEEIPFRGFMLQKLQERFDFSTSMVISSGHRGDERLT